MTSLPLINRHSKRPLLGVHIMYPGAGAIERIGSDWDWIWIDAQHGDIDFREAVNLIRAACLVGRPALVRVPASDTGWVGRVLDAGAAGVIIPMVETIAEARQFAQAAKFPPLGNRSYGGRRVIDCLGRGFYKEANRDTVLILQVESEAAAALANEFAVLDGVDGLFLGPDDFAIRLGRDVDAPKTPDVFGSALRNVAESCRRHGKLSVGIGVGEHALAMAREFSYNLVVGGSDVGFLAHGSKVAVQKLTQYLTNEVGGNGGNGVTATPSLY